jgi:hypothetical protein
VEREKDNGGVREGRGVAQRHNYISVREREREESRWERERGSGRSKGERE